MQRLFSLVKISVSKGAFPLMNFCLEFVPNRSNYVKFMNFPEKFDVIVVGAGHAGTEAAMAAARMGCRTLLLTQNIETLGQMSCNPAIGGIGKGHLVKEIDAMGGVMARAIDLAGIHFRILNRRKGPAVRATRAQADRALYKNAIRQFVENQENLFLFQQSVEDLIVEQDNVAGVVTQMGLKFFAPCVVLTVGTFLGGKIHIGEKKAQGGRAGDPASIGLAERLRALPFKVGRLKTGTPPRIDGKTINYDVLETQPGDNPTPVFSFMGNISHHPRQTVCHITRTNEQTHEIIQNNLNRSAMYSGEIDSVGPRYCPSIEDKVVRFTEQNNHQIFIEPEGLNTHEVYPNGLSTSLPFDVQLDFIQSIEGFERAHITRPGYAIEYDYFEPQELAYSLETRYVSGLFFAGQINGTTGYEEAAAQGLIAGMNAALKVKGEDSWTPGRDEAYMGVMIDDLITQGTMEPYRMFTSRAEYRLLLREDNADARLSEKAHKLGMLSQEQWQSFSEKMSSIETEAKRLKSIWFSPDSEASKNLETILNQPISKDINAFDCLKRPEVSHADLVKVIGLDQDVSEIVGEQITIQARYDGYIQRQVQEIRKLKEQNQKALPENFDYWQIKSLSNELKQKLTEVQPKTIGQASRIAGMTPAALSLLLIYLKKNQLVEEQVA